MPGQYRHWSNLYFYIFLKLKINFLPSYYLIFQSYLAEGQFDVRYRTSLLFISTTKAGVPQEAIGTLHPLNFSIAELPTFLHFVVG